MSRTATQVIPDAPHEVLLVLDATTGQNGLEQARKFTETSGVTGIVLTKLDGTAKGGVVVAIARELNLPIRYIGVGEKVDDLLPFDPEKFIESLFEQMTLPDYMREALDLARQGRVAGQSQSAWWARCWCATARWWAAAFTPTPGCKHAEIMALEEAGERARGATLYINLEPCSHQGRTPPCADALIAGGRGAGGRRHAGSQSAGGRAGLRATCARPASKSRSPPEFTAEAEKLNEPFLHFMRTGRPLVTLKTAHHAGRQDRRARRQPRLDHQRARPRPRAGTPPRSDAILTGIGTVLADDCLLTRSHRLPRSRPLLRIVLDSLLRLPLDSKMVRSARGDVLVVTTCAALRRAAQAAGIARRRKCCRSTVPAAAPTCAASSTGWAAQRYLSLMIEAGSKLNWTRARIRRGRQDLLLLRPQDSGRHGIAAAGRRHRAAAPRGCDPHPQHHRSIPFRPTNSPSKDTWMFTGIIEELGTVVDPPERALSDPLLDGADRRRRGRQHRGERRLPDGRRSAPRLVRRRPGAGNAAPQQSGRSARRLARESGAAAVAQRAAERPHRAGPRGRHRRVPGARSARRRQLVAAHPHPRRTRSATWSTKARSPSTASA